MTLVGFDTSLAVTSAAVVRADGAAFCTDPPTPERLRAAAAHSRELLPELVRLLADSGTGWGDVESIAVGVGPGTFTGLRIGVSTARALAQALDVGLRPVSSLDALAAGIAAAEPEPGRALLPLIDAKRGQVFAALYRAPAAGAGSGLERVWGPEAIDPAELRSRLHELAEAPICAGDWALESHQELAGAGAEVARPDSGLHAVSALQVCALGASIEPVAPGDVRPVYVRSPDAELKSEPEAGEPQPR